MGRTTPTLPGQAEEHFTSIVPTRTEPEWAFPDYHHVTKLEKLKAAMLEAGTKVAEAAATVKAKGKAAGAAVSNVLSLEDVPMPVLTAEEQKKFATECWEMFRGCQLKMRLSSRKNRAVTAYGAHSTYKQGKAAVEQVRATNPFDDLQITDLEVLSDAEILAQALAEEHPDVVNALDEIDHELPLRINTRKAKVSKKKGTLVDDIPLPGGIDVGEFRALLKELREFCGEEITKLIGIMLAEMGLSLPVVKVISSSIMLANSGQKLVRLKVKDYKIHKAAKATENLYAKFGAAGLDVLMRKTLKYEYATGATRIADFATAVSDPTTIAATVEGAATAATRFAMRLVRLALSYKMMKHAAGFLKSQAKAPPPGFFPQLFIDCPLLACHFFYRQEFPEETPEATLKDLVRNRLRASDLMLLEKDGTLDTDLYDPSKKQQFNEAKDSAKKGIKAVGQGLKNAADKVADGARSVAQSMRSLVNKNAVVEFKPGA